MALAIATSRRSLARENPDTATFRRVVNTNPFVVEMPGQGAQYLDCGLR